MAQPEIHPNPSTSTEHHPSSTQVLPRACHTASNIQLHDDCSRTFDSYSQSNDQHLQQSNNGPTSHNNNAHSDSRLTQNHDNLHRLSIQNLPTLQATDVQQPRLGNEGADEHSTMTATTTATVLRADGHVLNPDKLRSTTSALTTSICSTTTVESIDLKSFKGISRLIHRHYSRVDYVRSEARLAKETYLIGNIKFNRWIFLPAAFCFQAVCGTLYAWSVFNNLIDNALYSTDDGTPTTIHMAAITFYVALGCFGVASSIMGPWLERHGPKKAGLLGAALFLTGNLITAVGIYVKQISLVYVGYGIFGGLGLGISYISPVSALQKWFPDRRGVAAGLAVSGFGAGSIVMAKIPDPLSAAVGLPLTFVVLGCVYFVIMVFCAFVFRVPPPGYVVNGMNVWAVRVDDVDELNDIKLKGTSIEQSSHFGGDTEINTGTNSYNVGSLHLLHTFQQSDPHRSVDEHSASPISPNSATPTVVPSMVPPMKASERQSAKTGARSSFDPSTSLNLMDALYSREFRLMYIMFLGNTMAGVVIISRLANVATDIFGHSKDSASTIVSINGGFNLLGRLVFASLSDRIGRKNSYLIMLGSQIIILACLPIIMKSGANWAFLMVVWILTACYGGGFGCIPAFLCDMFGPSNIGPLHGVILTSWSLSSVGAGLLFTAVYNRLLKSGYTVHDDYIYAVNVHWLLAGVVCGLFVTLFIRTGMRDRLLPDGAGEWFHIRVFGRIMRFGRFGVRWMSKEEEQQAWTAYVVQRQLEDEQDHDHQNPGVAGERDRTLDGEEKAIQTRGTRL